MDANGLEIPAFEFDGRTFDAREVVQRYRKRWPLKELQQGLSKHHEDTRKELVELINEKYADFVSLSSRMQGVERALKPLDHHWKNQEKSPETCTPSWGPSSDRLKKLKTL